MVDEFLRYRAQVMRYVRTLTSSGEEAADLLQDLCLVLLRARARPDPRGPFLGYCRGVARNLALHRHRAARRRDELFAPEGQGLEAADPAAASPERVMDTRQAVRIFLRRLDPESRRLLVLRYVQGWTAEEIAHQLGQSPAAVRMRLMRLRERVRRSLGGGRR